MKIKTILNASEHLFNLNFSETLMLRNYARSNNMHFCSMIGGPESIRDIQEAKNLFANSLEFQTIESFFAIEKICSAIKKIFKIKEEINKIIIIINISTPDGINLLDNIEKIKISHLFDKSNFVFNLDRRNIAKNLLDLKNDNFNYQDHEKQINPLICKNLDKLRKNKFKTSISGGITLESISNIYKTNLPDYIKTGLFTTSSAEYRLDELQNNVIYFQKSEDKLLKLMQESVYYRYNYLDERQRHLRKYFLRR